MNWPSTLSSLEVVRIERDVKGRSSAVRAADAIAATVFLPRLRMALIFVWISAGSSLVLLTATVCWTLLRWFYMADDAGPLEATKWVLGSVLGRSPEHPAVMLTAISTWTAAAGIVLLALGASLGQLVWQTLRLRLLVWRSSRETRSRRVQLVAIVEQLSAMGGMASPRVLVLPRDAFSASATVVGFGPHGRIIAIGAGCLDLLDPDELYALLAHELAHHLNGDCARHVVLRFLGRASLFGDGFVAVLEHSLRYEIDADRTAIERLGADPSSLASCIRKMAAISIVDRHPRRDGLSVGGAKAGDSRSHHSRGRANLWESLRDAARAWWSCYTCDTAMGYWHPTLPDRLAALEVPNASSGSAAP